VDESRDCYRAWIYLEDRVVPVEKIHALIEELTQKPIFQEELTQALADRLEATVKTRGCHVQGDVKTVVLCSPSA
jgi:GTP cyclohydrolase I